MKRSYYAFLNYAGILVLTVVSVATGFLTVPWLLDWLGSTRFGAARMLLAVFGFLSLLEFGLSGAISPLLARALGRGDQDAVARTLAAGSKAYSRTSLLSIAFGIFLSVCIWRFGLINVSISDPSDVLRAGSVSVKATPTSDLLRACLISLVGLLFLFCVPFRSLIEARQRGFQITLLLTGQCLLVAACALAFARCGWGISGQAAATAIGTVVFYLMVVAIVRKDSVGYLAAIRAPTDPAIRKEIRHLSMPSLMINVSGRLSVMSDDLIVGLLLGTDKVASFYVVQRLALLARQQLESIGGAVWAGLAELHVQGKHADFRRNLIEATKTVCVLGAGVLAPIVAYNDIFVHLWVKNAVSFSGSSLVCPVAAFNAIIISLNSLWGWSFSGTGKVRLMSKQAVIGTVINVVTSVLFTYKFGMVGPLLGTTVAYLGLPMWYLPLQMNKTFGVSLRATASAVLVPLAVGVACSLSLVALLRFHQPQGWVSLGVEMALAGVVCLALAFRFSFDAGERSLWRRRIQSIVARLARRGQPDATNSHEQSITPPPAPELERVN